MRFSSSGALWLPFAMTLAGCSGTFDASGGADAGVGDATEENPLVQGIGTGDGGGAHDGTSADAGHHDATTAAETGTSTGEGGTVVDEAGDEGPPPGCPTGDLQCSGACVPSDVHNCGTCGHDCTNLAHVAGATSCTAAGACSFPASACATGWADCDGNPDDGCETDITKPATCGSCTNACPANEPVCAAGTCVSGCPATTPTLCSGTCVDTTSNASDCNGCGLGCPNDVTNAQPTCASGQCTFTCNGGFSGCPTAAPTACVDEQHDATNCGGCANLCPAPSMSGTGQAACAAGVCTLDCNAGLTACPVANPAECTNTTTDLSNCGGCGDVCKTTVANATPTCAASQCGFACNSGFIGCPAAAPTTCIPAADTVNGAFVSPSGSGSTCSAAQPCTTIAAAIATGKTILYLDQGMYTEVVALAANVTIHGGWTDSAGSWTNCNGTNATSIIAAPAGQPSAVTMTSAGTLTLDTLTVENNTTASAGQSLYGVFATAGSLTLNNVSVSVAGGGAAAPVAAQGATGSAPPASCTAATSNAGANGSPAGAPGAGALQGTYGLVGFAPATGTPGQQGNPGTNGGPGATSTNCSQNSCAYAPQACGGTFCCTSSSDSTATCAITTSCGSSYCGQPGEVGCGGGGGGLGGGGNGGGASVGVFAGNAAVVLAGSVAIQTGAGGAGSSGGLGGNPANGSTGATGASATAPQSCGHAKSGTEYDCTVAGNTALLGGAGSTGGNGSAGGAGGGGAGGDSVCYALFGTGQVTGATPTCTPKSGGPGGNQGGGALQGAAGRSALHN